MPPPEHFERLRRELTTTLESVGFPHTISRVYAALTLAEGEGLSTSELVETLDVSKASISNATQFLVGTEIAQRYRVPGSREAHYRMIEGVWGPILTKKFMAMGQMRRTLEQALADDVPDAARHRLEEMYDVFAFFEEAFEEIMQRWDERTSS
jgi:DNA-binding transcriptional regulator GbsR (MarR family)